MRFCATVYVLRFRERIMLKRLVLLIILIVLLVVSVGCNTVQGVGKDIEWTGEKGAEIIGGK
jgi:predicted small secreted protein